MAMTASKATACSMLSASSPGNLLQARGKDEFYDGARFFEFFAALLLRIPRVQPLSTRVIEKNIVHGQQSSKRDLVVYADYNERRGGGAGDFVAGFLLGGALFGAIGYLIAPTVNKTLAAVAEKEKDDVEDEDPPKKVPKYLEDDEGLENTRKNLNEKIAQLNAAIDDVSAQLRADEGGFSNVNDSAVELESAA